MIFLRSIRQTPVKAENLSC